MKIKNIFKYYTSITYARFLALLAYLVPGNSRLKYVLINTLKSHGYVQDKDGMADKGFTIGNELQKLGLSLNIPPFA